MEEQFCPLCVIENQKLRERLRQIEESRDEFRTLAWRLSTLLENIVKDFRKILNRNTPVRKDEPCSERGCSRPGTVSNGMGGYWCKRCRADFIEANADLP